MNSESRELWVLKHPFGQQLDKWQAVKTSRDGIQLLF
jgi:hypothetical protein